MRKMIALIILWLAGCSSQPRFTHPNGAPPEQMFDNKTAQACWAGLVQVNDGKSDLEVAKRDLETKVQTHNKLYPGKQIGQNSFDRLLSDDRTVAAAQKRVDTAQARVNDLQQHPEKQRVLPNGLPYCSDLQ